MPTVSILPAFLQPGSPPRSPHVERPSFLSSVFVPREAPNPPRGGGAPSIKPTRRDVILCLLTLSFSYLLFFSPPSSDPIALNASGGSRYRIPGWSNFFPSSTGTSRQGSSGEVLFTDSVKAVSVGSADVEFGRGSSWDGGEEEDEDDEFEAMATVLKAHSPGWTIFEKLYIHNGSFYVVTEDKTEYPELRLMTSTGLPANNEPGNSEAREPKGDEIIYISPMDAAKLWGPRVYRMDGTTFLFNDGQFIDHYYHFAAELLLGVWRAYTSYDHSISSTGETSLPAPKRMWFLHQSLDEWRDNPRFNPLLMFTLFPQTSLLYPSDFADLAKQSISSKPKAFVLDRAILADRSAAFRGPFTGPTARTVAGALQVGETSQWWWEPIRRTVLRYAGVPQSIISRNLEGYGAVDPVTLDDPTFQQLEPLAPPGDYAPVVTYISRQNSRRRLTAESHADLVQALEEKAERLGWELVIVEAEKMTKEEQFALAGRTTIMLGVHGNGLTHLLWMPATPRSAVIEMFIAGGFARDYQWTAHALGIRHFGIQHDISFTSPSLPKVDYPEGFQGTGITVVGKVVADLIEDRLAGRV